MSFATVEASGPFSTFPGVDRVIVPVDGGDLVLCVDGTRTRLVPFEPFAFAGEAAVTCETTGRTLDFNVMVHRAYAAAAVAVSRLAPGVVPFRASPGERAFLVVLDGTATIDAEPLRSPIHLERCDVLELDATPSGVSGGAIVALVKIEERSGPQGAGRSPDLH